MKTIPRNHTRKIAEIKAKQLTCRVYDLRSNFVGKDCDPEFAWEELARFHFARLTVNSDGDVWTVRVHGNLWYELRE
jgi:hypothetical protein